MPLDPTTEIQTDNNHWDKLFKLCVFVIGAVIIYCFLITFVPIPKENSETARQVLIFFIGTLVGYCFNLLSPGITAKRPESPQLTISGDNTSISRTVNNDNPPSDPPSTTS